MYVRACESRKRISEPLKLDLQMLGIELGTLEEHGALFVEPGAISPAPTFPCSSAIWQVSISPEASLEGIQLSLCLVIGGWGQFKVIRAHCHMVSV